MKLLRVHFLECAILSYSIRTRKEAVFLFTINLHMNIANALKITVAVLLEVSTVSRYLSLKKQACCKAFSLPQRHLSDA